MEKNIVVIKVTLGILILLVVILIFKVNGLQYSIQDCSNGVNNMQDNLDSSIQNVNSNINDLRDEVLYGESIISSCETESVGVNGDNNTTKVKIGIIPKEASEDASLTLLVGEKSISMKNDVNDSSDYYYATIEIPIEGLNDIEKCPAISLSIEDEDNITSEDINDRLQDNFSEIFDVLLGKNTTTFSGEYSVNNKRVTFDGSIDYSLNNMFVDKAKKTNIVVLMDNKEEWSKELTDLEGKYDLQQYFDIPDNASGSLVVEIQGESGLKYRYHLIDFNYDDSTASNLYVSDCWIEICDKNGETLY